MFEWEEGVYFPKKKSCFFLVVIHAYTDFFCCLRENYIFERKKMILSKGKMIFWAKGIKRMNKFVSIMFIFSNHEKYTLTILLNLD